MSINCRECKFGEPSYCTAKKIFIDGRGAVVKEESISSQSLIICRPPVTRSGFLFRNKVSPYGYCDQGENK